EFSDWSAGVALSSAPDAVWQQVPVAQSTSEPLLAIQRALLRVCAARGDLFAVLTLPEHDHEDDALAHVVSLKAASGPASVVPRLGGGEAEILAFGAIYHPWLIGREEGPSTDLLSAPPDGATCGIMASRAIDRGAWIAPANEQ